MGRVRNPYRQAFDAARQRVKEAIEEAKMFENILESMATTIEDEQKIKNLKPGQKDKIRKQFHELLTKTGKITTKIKTEIKTQLYLVGGGKVKFGKATRLLPKNIYASIHREERVENLIRRLEGYFGDEWLPEWSAEIYPRLNRLSESDLYQLSKSMDGLNAMVYESDASFSYSEVEISDSAREIYEEIMRFTAEV